MDARSRDAVEEPLPLQAQTARRRLLLRDGLTFLTLTLVAIALGGVTSLLFRSFESHREDLAVRWAERGRQALQQGKSAEAVTALRTSLSYRPDVRENQLALARALAANGHTSEAENYFLNLWQSQPGDGLINLELARLKRQQNQTFEAIQYYRAAVFGTWLGDAPQRRRDTRLELSEYLVERGQPKAAQAELLIAAGNNPDAASQLRIAEALEAAQDPKDALTAYRNVTDDKRFGSTAAAKIGELCYRMGDYGCAGEELGKALRRTTWTAEQKNRMSTLQQQAERLQELSFSHDLPSFVRAEHLMADARLVQARLAGCASQSSSDAGATDNVTALASLQAQWKQLDTPANRSALRHDEDLQDSYRELIFSSEKAAANACGSPTGDDALLLYLADHPATRFGAQS